MIKKIFVLLILIFLTASCSHTEYPTAQVPTLESDDKMFDSLILDPKTNLDLLNNLNVFEFLYVNQKIQTYNLMVYISQLATDKESEELYKNKINEIYSIYGISP